MGLDGPGLAQSVNGPVHFDCSTRCGARSGVDGWGRGGRELCFDVSHGCVHESYVDTLKVQLVYFQQKKKKKKKGSHQFMVLVDALDSLIASGNKNAKNIIYSNLCNTRKNDCEVETYISPVS